MFTTKNGERLYLQPWNYNALLILNELVSVVELYGGRVKPFSTALISNRSIDASIDDYKRKILTLKSKINQVGNAEIIEERLKVNRAKLNELMTLDNSPKMAVGQSWIHFVLGDRIYYYSFPDNPFYHCEYRKTMIVDGEYSLDAYCRDDPMRWSSDALFGNRCTNTERKIIADSIFRMLIEAPDSHISRRCKKRRVYEGRSLRKYHYITVYEKERKAKVDF